METSKIIKDGNQIIVVKILLHGSPRYFSVTGEIWGAKDGKKSSPDMLTGGCIHDEILKYFPEMKDIVSLHLSNMNGIPMYAISNGYYYYKQSPKQGFDYIRLPEVQRNVEINDENEFASLVESLKPMYKKEAEEAILKYNL